MRTVEISGGQRRCPGKAGLCGISPRTITERKRSRPQSVRRVCNTWRVCPSHRTTARTVLPKSGLEQRTRYTGLHQSKRTRREKARRNQSTKTRPMRVQSLPLNRRRTSVIHFNAAAVVREPPNVKSKKKEQEIKHASDTRSASSLEVRKIA